MTLLWVKIFMCALCWKPEKLQKILAVGISQWEEWDDIYLFIVKLCFLSFQQWIYITYNFLVIWKKITGVSIVVQWKWIRLVTMRLRVWSLASLSGLRIWRCRELWCRLQTWLGSCAVASSCSSASTPCLGTSVCMSVALKSKKISSYKRAIFRSFRTWRF